MISILCLNCCIFRSEYRYSRQDYIECWFCKCCIVVCTSWLPVSQNNKRPRVPQARLAVRDRARPRLFSWAVWHSCRMGARNQEQTRGRIGPQLRLGNLRVGELHFCPLCTALDQASSLSRKMAYVPGPTFGFVKLLASSGSHCTKWADEQHRQAGFESRLVPDLPLPFIPTLIGLRAFDLVSSRVWWEAATNIWQYETDRSRNRKTALNDVGQ